jgi:hypothetical protein
MSFILSLLTCGNGIWEWEIRRRDNRSRRRCGTAFKSHDAALEAGKIALREFVELLELQPESDG